jgi:hypothetical protein
MHPAICLIQDNPGHRTDSRRALQVFFCHAEMVARPGWLEHGFDRVEHRTWPTLACSPDDSEEKLTEVNTIHHRTNGGIEAVQAVSADNTTAANPSGRNGGGDDQIVARDE